MLNKVEIISHLVKLQEEKILSLKKSLSSTQKCVIDAPGSNVSHSDTSKFQYSNIALGLEKKIIEAGELLSRIKIMDFSIKNIVSLGSLIKVKDESIDNTIIYFILQSGGDIFEINGIQIICITLKAPLARAFLGKKVKDKVDFMEKTYKIIEIQ